MQMPPKAPTLHDTDPAVGTPEPIDHSPGNLDFVVNDVALSHREHAEKQQGSAGVDARSVR